VLGKEKKGMPLPSAHDEEEGPDLTPPEEGYELYRHTDSANMATTNWHGYYWARRIEEGDYEIRTVPSSLGEASASGGVFPKRGFEGHYEKVDT
jgi:hypothetical protein